MTVDTKGKPCCRSGNRLLHRYPDAQDSACHKLLEHLGLMNKILSRYTVMLVA